MTNQAVDDLDRRRLRTAKLGQRPDGRRAAGEIASASALGKHLGVTRQYVSRLADDGVIERVAGGFDIDASRLRYLGWLRDPARRAVKSAAESEFQKAKTRLIELRIAEKERALIPLDESIATIDLICGIVLTKLSGMAARCSRDLTVRRAIDNVVREIRIEISEAASKLADERGEPEKERRRMMTDAEVADQIERTDRFREPTTDVRF